MTLPQGMIYTPSVLKAHVRTGHMAQYIPASTGYANILSDHQIQPAVQPVFQAKVSFYDVAYPYWQWPWHNGPYAQAQLPGFKRSLAQLGYVGAPLPAGDYNTPLITAYSPVSYTPQRYG